ncbi:MAG TPA: hypothetical protein VG456_20745 [Candidatus Sulfopaludibacter sp.]|nr:hypothetical protein [Candidatus Sulfopaludibacter sp.]
MVRRYRSWIVGPTFAGLVISVVVAFLWPDTFRSQAVMRITPPKVSEKLVPSEITQHMNERLNQMQQEILSRSQLASMIQQPALNLYPKERLQKPIEDIVQDMRTKYIQIRMLGVPGVEGSKGASAFSISFDYPDKYRAKLVVDQLVAKFMEQNGNVIKLNTRLTTQFIDDELKTASDRMNKLSSEITKFRMLNPGKLPEQASANATMISSLQQAIATENEGLNRATNQKLMEENQLAGLQNDLAFQSQHLEDTVMTGGSPGQQQLSVKNQRLIELDRDLSSLQNSLSEARKMYRDDYPPIKNLIARIDNLQKQREEVEKNDQAARAAAPTATGPTAPTAVKIVNPQVQQRMEELKNQISSAKTSLAITTNEIQTRQNHITEINRRVQEYQVRIEAAPLVEQQYTQMLGDYELAKQQYNDFSKRKGQSETQENINEHQAGESLEVLDPASLPEQSFEPIRSVWVGAGTAIGMMLGIMLAGAKEMKDSSLKNLKDVRAYTNLPILSSIPLLENALLVRRKRRLFWLAWSSAFIVGSIAMSGAMYYHFFGKS